MKFNSITVLAAIAGSVGAERKLILRDNELSQSQNDAKIRVEKAQDQFKVSAQNDTELWNKSNKVDTAAIPNNDKTFRGYDLSRPRKNVQKKTKDGGVFEILNSTRLADVNFLEGVKNGSITRLSFSQDEIDQFAKLPGRKDSVFLNNIEIGDGNEVPALYHNMEADDLIKTDKGTNDRTAYYSSHPEDANKTELEMFQDARSKGIWDQIFPQTWNGHLRPIILDVSFLDPAWVLPQIDLFVLAPITEYLFVQNGDPFKYRSVGFNQHAYPAGTIAYQMAFRSDNLLNLPDVATSLIVIPKHNDNTHFIMYQAEEDAVALNCMPSYSFMSGEGDPTLRLFLHQNWVVGMPDYQGPRSSFGASRLGGHIVLNAARALMTIGDSLFYNNKVGFLYGYSTGSASTGMAAEIMKSTAADLQGHIIGAFVGGYFTDLRQIMTHVNKSLFAGFIALFIEGLGHEYPLLNAYFLVEQELSSYYDFFSTYFTCSNYIAFQFAGKNMFNYFAGRESVFDIPLVKNVLSQQRLGTEVPSIPMFVMQSATDEIVPVGDVDRTVDYYCKHGVPLEYHRVSGRTHLGEGTFAPGYGVGFFRRLIARDVPPTCADWQGGMRNVRNWN